MYTRLKAWFTGRSEDRDDRRREDAARVLEMDEPMAGAGALLSGTHHGSETEDALRRATEREPKTPSTE